jgi:hypothetical protein
MGRDGFQIVMRHFVKVGYWTHVADANAALIAKRPKTSRDAHIDALPAN